MIIARFKMRLNQKKRNELLNAVRNISQEARKEDGCVDNLVFQSIEDDNELVMIEYWKSKMYMKKHWNTLNFSALLGLQNLLDKPMDIEIGKITNTNCDAEIQKTRIRKKTTRNSGAFKIK
jgi:quinol monooxygenase YgiN